jgi:DNA polymerase III sliding clamp (beta) subunit (PCNA family)
MSTTQSGQSGETEASQVSLTDTNDYLTGSDGGLPEDIEREFAVEDTPALETLQIPSETISKRIQPDWVPAEGLLDGDDTAVWNGDIPLDVMATVTDHLHPTISEIKIAVHNDGWLIKVVDPANVSMFRVWLSAADFDEYNVVEEGVVGVDLSTLADTFDQCRGDSVTVSVDGEQRTLSVDSGTAVEIPLIDPASIRQSPDIPELDINQELTLPGVEFTALIDRLSVFSDHIAIESDAGSGGVMFVADGDTLTADTSYSTPQDVTTAAYRQAKHQFECAVTADTHSLFSVDKLTTTFGSLTKKTTQERYELTFDGEFPMQIQSPLATDSHLMYMLAPRISDE